MLLFLYFVSEACLLHYDAKASAQLLDGVECIALVVSNALNSKCVFYVLSLKHACFVTMLGDSYQRLVNS